MRPIRVLMVINQFHPTVGGAERQAQKLAQALIERGLHVEVLTARRRGLKKRELVGNIPVRRHRVLHVPLRRRKLFYTLSYMARVFLYLLWNRKSFDIVHVHQALYPAFACSLAAKLLGKRSIVKSASSGDRFDLAQLEEKPLIGRIMVRSICQNTDCFVAISTHIREDLARFGIACDRIVMIPNGVDIPSEGRTRRRSCCQDVPLDGHDQRPRFIAGFVGTLSATKNVEMLLRAWAMIPADVREGCRLLIVGDGPERARLEARAVDLGIAQKVTFCGRRRNVAQSLDQMDCYVSMSVVEGLSNSLLEAMAHKKACIVSDGVSGNVDLIQDGDNGFLVDPSDHQHLVKRLTELASDRHLVERLGERASDTVSKTCGMPLVVAKYLDLYQSLV